MKKTLPRSSQLLKELTGIGIALTAEKDHVRLMEIILRKAMELTCSDGGTFYSCTPDNQLQFEIMITESLGLYLGGRSGGTVDLPRLSLLNEKGQPNTDMVSTWAANSRKTVNIRDAYHEKKFDFSGTRNLDKKNNYHSQSLLTVPMINHVNQVIGVLQLVNAKNPQTGKIRTFRKRDQDIVESLASQAAMVITQKNLINAQKNLFDSLIQLIANSIDEKSAYTGGHCRRVPILTNMIVEAACNATEGPLKDFTLSEDEKYELEVSAWLHDCGKIITPEHVVDKATKLESIFDRVHLIETRFEVLKRDEEIAFLRKQLEEKTGKKPQFDEAMKARLSQLDTWRDRIKEYNLGGENMTPEQIAMIDRITELYWTTPDNMKEPFLSPEEALLLKINKGTLSIDERQIIQNHVVLTAKMLQSLPYPENLKNVPHYAAAHHEKLNGSGYPKALKGAAIPMQARIIAIADIFEALTASDRPYKKSMSLTQAIQILKKMGEAGELDQDLLDIFLNNEIHLKYAREYLRE